MFGLDPVEGGGDLGDRLVVAGVGDAEDRDDPDGVLVDVRGELMGEQAGGAGLQRHLAQFHVEVAGELLPADLHRSADQVGAVGRLALGAAAGAPAPFEGEPAEHRGLAGAGGGAAGRGAAGRGVPQVGEDVDAARLDLGGLRVLVLVDHVLVDALAHQTAGAVVRPGGAEGGQVLGRVAVEQQFVVEQGVDDLGGRVLLRHPVLGQYLAAERGREHVGGEVCADVRAAVPRAGGSGGYVLHLVKCHIGTIRSRCPVPAGRRRGGSGRSGRPTASGRLRSVTLHIVVTYARRSCGRISSQQAIFPFGPLETVRTGRSPIWFSTQLIRRCPVPGPLVGRPAPR